MPYDLRTAVSGMTSFPVILTAPLTVPKLVATIENNVPGKSHWRKAGYVQAVASTNIGLTTGRSQMVLFGQQELDLEVPAYPYQLRFEPCHYVIKYSLYLYEKDKAWADGTPSVPIVETAKGKVRRVIFYTPNTLPALALQQRENRTSATLYNASTSLIYIGFSSNLSPSNALETLYPGGQWVSDGGDIGEIWMMSDTVSSTSLQIIEYSQD
jgi:hypothetical protein